MAKRRMISITILCSDKFLDLAISQKMLYVYLILQADDDGMLSNTRAALMYANADKEDLAKLVDSGFLIAFDSGVYAITHWPVFNHIQPARKTNTDFVSEFEQLEKLKDGSYGIKAASRRRNDDKTTAQYNSVEINPVKESEVKESEEKDNTNTTHRQSNADDVALVKLLENEDFKTAKNEFTDKIGALRNPDEYEMLAELLRKYGKAHVLSAIDKTSDARGNTVQYLEKVCKTL